MMTVLRHELRQARNALIIWAASIGFLMVICILLFPEMKGEMEGVSDIFASMGSFTAAFGMDRLAFGELRGFYAVECGNILGLGGAFFAALQAILVLAKEEKGRTAEFLLTHPLSRGAIVTGKLLGVFVQIILLNLAVTAMAFLSMAFIGEEIPWKDILLLHGAYFLLQLELAGICFGISAFLRRGGLGVGLGLAIMAYFLNIIANISDKAEFLKYITPFGYTEGADIFTSGSLEWDKVLIGMGLMAVGIVAGYFRYCTKDITA